MSKECISVVFCLLCSLVISVSSAGQNAITTVDISTSVMPESKLLLGITYDCRSSLSNQTNTLLGYHNTNGSFNPAVAAVFDNFPMSTLRYPGNGILQGFDWKKTIGPVASRTPQQIFAQSLIPAQVLEFGFDEFMAMTAARGVLPKDVQIMVPIYDQADASLTPTQLTAALPGVALSNADWVEYANAANDGSNPGGGTEWAAVRAANGHPAPYGIKLWNMGNEPYTPGEYTPTGVANYINNIIPIIDAMLAIDPTIKITVTVTGNMNAWTVSILNSSLLQGKIYGINCHFFITEEVLPATLPANQPNVYNCNNRIIALASAAQAKGYKLIIGDNAHAIISTANPTQAEQDIAMQWQGANETTDFLLTLSQVNNMERANFWIYGLWSNQWHPIRNNNNGTFTSMPVAEMYKKLNPAFLDHSVAATTTSPVATDGILYSVRSSAFMSADLSRLNVVSVNRDKINGVSFKINGITGYTVSTARLITATSLDADVINETTITPDISGNYSIPAMGVLIVEYTRTVLPLNWISFTATKTSSNAALLQWSTASEINNDFFDIERCSNSTAFERIGTVASTGVNSVIANYQFTDMAPLKNGVFYRLKQVDKNGAYQYSQTVKLFITSIEKYYVLHSSPAELYTDIVFNNDVSNLDIVLSDFAGKIAHRKSASSVKAGETIRINLGRFQKGIYILTLQSSKGKFIERLVKL